MFNNVAVNVAIGLVFIYLLYSLLATTIKEFIATIFAYRGRMLERGIEQMLDGKNYSYYWWEKMLNIFIWIIHRLKIFFKNNKIKTLKKKNLPNSGVVQTISPIKFSDFIADKTIDTNQDKATKVKRVVLNTKNKLFASKITAHPLYKRSAENSAFFKKPAYLSADTFSDILIDILKPDPAVPVLLKDIAASVSKKAVDVDDPLNKDLERILRICIEQANGDLQRFKMLVENWYDDTMGRVSGWYKKQANRILLIIGFLLAVTFNISTIDIVQKLSTDKALRENLANHATEYLKAHAADTSLKNNKTYTGLDSIAHQNDSLLLVKAQNSLKDIDSLYNGEISSTNTIIGLGWGDYGYTEDTIQYKKDSIKFIKDAVAYENDPDGKIKKPKEPQIPVPPANRGTFDKVAFVIYQTVSIPHKWLGFLLTAFAISLGAPFWFDLLNKFINLRVSGAKPDDNKEKNSSSKTTGLNQPIVRNPKAFG